MAVNRKQPIYCENHGGRCPEKQIDPATGLHNCEGCVWVQAPPNHPAPCQLCEAGDESLGVNCYNCGNVFHIHQAQLRKVPVGTIVAGTCPYCKRSNAWRRTAAGVEYSGPLMTIGESILDLRGTK